jgi:hypothetical protein
MNAFIRDVHCKDTDEVRLCLYRMYRVYDVVEWDGQLCVAQYVYHNWPGTPIILPKAKLGILAGRGVNLLARART